MKGIILIAVVIIVFSAIWFIRPTTSLTTSTFVKNENQWYVTNRILRDSWQVPIENHCRKWVSIGVIDQSEALGTHRVQSLSDPVLDNAVIDMAIKCREWDFISLERYDRIQSGDGLSYDGEFAGLVGMSIIKPSSQKNGKRLKSSRVFLFDRNDKLVWHWVKDFDGVVIYGPP